MQLLLSFILRLLGVSIAAYLVPGVMIENLWTTIVLVVVLSILNTIVKPILTLLTLPLTILTLGLFLLVINVVIVLLAAAIVPGFSVATPMTALLFSVVLWLVNLALSALLDRPTP